MSYLPIIPTISYKDLHYLDITYTAQAGNQTQDLLAITAISYYRAKRDLHVASGNSYIIWLNIPHVCIYKHKFKKMLLSTRDT